MAILSEETIVTSSAEVTIYKLLNDTVTAQVSSTAVDVLDATSITMVVETAASTSGGVVTLEGAVTSDYSGTWASLGTVTTSAATTAYAVTYDTGDTAGLPMPYVRARISTVISGGSVDVYLIVRKG